MNIPTVPGLVPFTVVDAQVIPPSGLSISQPLRPFSKSSTNGSDAPPTEMAWNTVVSSEP